MRQLRAVLAVVTLVALVVGCASSEVRAVRRGDLDAIAEYIEDGGDVNAPQRGGASLLMIAAGAGQLDSAVVLVENGARVEMRDNRGRTALMYAASSGHEHVARYLLDEGAAIDAVDSGGQSAVIFAAAQNHATVARLLIDRGADFRIVASGGWTALLWALNAGAAGQGINATARVLIDAGAPLDPFSAPSVEVAFRSASAGNLEVLDLLIDAGLAPMVPGPGGNLLVVAGAAHLDVLRYLLDMGVSVNARTAGGVTPLMAAAESGALEAVRLLLNRGADPNIVSAGGSTALLAAASRRDVEVVRLLLIAGANPLAVDRHRNNSLHLAASRSDPPTVSLLVTAGIDVNAPNGAGQTPVELAAQNPDREEIIRVLVAAGAKVPKPAAEADSTGGGAVVQAPPPPPPAVEPVAPPVTVIAPPAAAAEPTSPPATVAAAPAATAAQAQTPPGQAQPVVQPAQSGRPLGEPVITAAGSQALKAVVSWPYIRPNNVEGWARNDPLLPRVTIRMRYYREKDWFLIHDTTIELSPSGAGRFSRDYDLKIDVSKMIECQLAVPTSGGTTVNSTIVRQAAGLSLTFAFEDFRSGPNPDVVWPERGTAVEVGIKYAIPPLNEELRARLADVGDEPRVRGQNRVPVTIRVLDESGKELVRKDDTFDPAAVSQGGFFPRTWRLPEGSTIRYTFEAATRRGGSLLLERQETVHTLYSHETQFRTAAETVLNPPPSAWSYRPE
jgi:ankyrin repeat protein